MNSPRVVIGIPVYEGGALFRESLESILSQDYRDLRVVVTDDGAREENRAIVEEYRALDDRVEYVRNARRLGMIHNWREAFELGRRRYPDAEYFAWASDHDVWHPYWASSLVRELDADPALTVAYPRNLGIDADGRPLLPGAKAGFQTAGVTAPFRRLRMTVADMAAGNMIYGLFRASVLAECGIFPPVLLPDRLLLAKLAIRGQFREVPRTLWYRRFLAGVRPSLDRQRASFFPDGVPPSARLPWWAAHGGAMTAALVLRGEGRPAVGRARGVLYAAGYFLLTLRFHLGRRRHRLDRTWNRLQKRLRKFRRRVRRKLVRVARRGAKVVRRLLGRLRRIPMLRRLASGRLGGGIRREEELDE